VGGEVRGNYCTWNPLDTFGPTFANGNLDASYNTTSWKGYRSTIAPTSGKWYWEVTVNTLSGSNFTNIGVSKAIGAGGVAINSDFDNTAETAGYNSTGVKVSSTYGGGSYGASFTAGDVIGVGLDVDAGTLVFYKNGTSQGTAYSNLTANAAWTPAMSMYGNVAISVNFGQRPFAYQTAGTNRPASTYKALNTASLPAPLVTKPNTVFDTVLWTGNDTGQTITMPGAFSPDLVWTKMRSAANAHWLFDVVRGTNQGLSSSSTTNELTRSSSVTAFGSTGFTLGTSADVNSSAYTYVAWTWDAGSSTVTNTQGSISSQVRANATAGFSVVGFDAGAGGQVTMGHGLGVAPSLIILKRRTAVESWYVWTQGFTTSEYLILNGTSAKATSTNLWGTSLPSSTLFGFNANSGTHVAYCFAPVVGYSSFGSYTGNGSSDGPFVYTGFRPAFVMLKESSASGNGWEIRDSMREPYNDSNRTILLPNLSNAEITDAYPIDFTSNGFKVRNAGGGSNNSGATYIYAAFAESPFNYARAR
jgi:hypothetical protein